MDESLKIFPTPDKLAEKFAEEMVSIITRSVKQKKLFSVALSGGSTPELLYSVLGEHYPKLEIWEFVHFFWGDERCVPPDDPESNYGMARHRLFEKIIILSSNIHRIKGENDPYREAQRYSEEISEYVRKKNDLPSFDLIILGLGEDGHTASIFPGNKDLFFSEKICEVALHPVTQQKRITLTGKVINNADFVAFLVTGNKKAEIVEKILKKNSLAINYPASYIDPVHGVVKWFIDKEAGRLL